MDTVLAKTFIEVIASGSFADAAKRLFVSQSAISLRIKSLEDQLGRKVFLRSKTGITLTPAGHQFQRYAQSLLQVWEEAKQQVAVPEGYKDVIVIAGEHSLWNRLLVHWLPLMANNMPDTAFRAEVARYDRITRQMIEGTVDIAVMYTPQVRPGLCVEALFDDSLVMVSTNEHIEGIDRKYVFVDWGEEFAAFHANNFPDHRHPRMTFSIGPMTVNYLLNVGGTAYMPKRLIEPLLASAKLYLVPDMPLFEFPVHVAWRDRVKEALIDEALAHIRKTAEHSVTDQLPAPFWMNN